MTKRVKLVLLLIGAVFWGALYDVTVYTLFVAKMSFVGRLFCDCVCLALYLMIASRIYTKHKPV